MAARLASFSIRTGQHERRSWAPRSRPVQPGIAVPSRTVLSRSKDAGGADADGPQVVTGDAGLAQHLGDGGAIGGEPVLGVQVSSTGLK